MKSIIMALVFLSLLSFCTLAIAQDIPNHDLSELYSDRKYEQALTLGLERLEQDPANRYLNQMVGCCMVDLNRRDEGKHYLQKVVDEGLQDDCHSWSLIYLGIIAWRAGDDVTATKAWTEVRDGKLTLSIADLAKRNLHRAALSEAFADWTRIQTEHCIFYFSTAHAERDLTAFAEIHEQAYVQLTDYFGSETPYPVRYIVWGSTDEAREISGINALGFATSRYCLINCRWNQSVGHEMTHVVSQQALKPVVRTPLINEGLATCFDMSNRNRVDNARRALQEADMSELDLVSWWGPIRIVDDGVLYPVAGAWVQTLLDKGGKEKLLELCKEQTVAKAREIYGDDLDVWMEQFVLSVLPDVQGE